MRHVRVSRWDPWKLSLSFSLSPRWDVVLRGSGLAERVRQGGLTGRGGDAEVEVEGHLVVGLDVEFDFFAGQGADSGCGERGRVC